MYRGFPIATFPDGNWLKSMGHPGLSAAPAADRGSQLRDGAAATGTLNEGLRSTPEKHSGCLTTGLYTKRKNKFR